MYADICHTEWHILYFCLSKLSEMINVTAAMNATTDEIIMYMLFLNGVGYMIRNIKYPISKNHRYSSNDFKKANISYDLQFTNGRNENGTSCDEAKKPVWNLHGIIQ